MSLDPSHAQQVKAAIQAVLSSNFDADSKACLLTCLKLLDNLLQNEANVLGSDTSASAEPLSKYRTIKRNNPALCTKIFDRPGGLDLIQACGFQEQQAQGIHTLSTEQVLVLPNSISLDNVRSMRAIIAECLYKDMNLPLDQIPMAPARKPPIQLAAQPTASNAVAFDPYRGQRFDGQSAALGVNLGPGANYVSPTEQALADLQSQKNKLEKNLLQKPLDREWTWVVRSQTATDQTDSAAATDTPSDSRLLAGQLQKQNEQRSAREQFTTQAMRDLKKLKTAKVYSHTVLTIVFPNAMVGPLQGHFRPNEKVSDVINSLQQDCIQGDYEFDLFITPPRRVLETNVSLQDAALVPAARVYVSWKKGPTSGTRYLQDYLIPKEDVASLAFPTAYSVAASAEKASETKEAPAATAATPVVDKEAALLQRMMGGKAGLGSKSKADGKSDGKQPPKWFKGFK
jgi:PUB domain/UBX domain